MKKIIGISLLLVAAVIFSCQKENINTPASDGFSEKSAQIAVTEVQLESVSTETEYEVEFYANAERLLTRWVHLGKWWIGNGRLRYLEHHCPNVTVDAEGEDAYPKTITLDYGDSTMLRNGKVLSGQIIIDITAPRSSQDYSRTITYNDFGIDSIKINGTSLVTVDKVDTMLRQFKSDFNITLADGSTVTRSSERTWQWIEGFDTEDDPSDDVILITGFVNAELNGDVYKKEIVTPLKRIGDCRFIVEGVVNITLNDELLCSIDYGDGTCDGVATVTKDGETYEIDLQNHKMNRRQEHANNQNGNAGNSNSSGNGSGSGNSNGNSNSNGNGSGNGNGNGNGNG